MTKLVENAQILMKLNERIKRNLNSTMVKNDQILLSPTKSGQNPTWSKMPITTKIDQIRLNMNKCDYKIYQKRRYLNQVGLNRPKMTCQIFPLLPTESPRPLFFNYFWTWNLQFYPILPSSFFGKVVVAIEKVIIVYGPTGGMRKRNMIFKS